MANNNESILAVPTNVITGFLGVGKTSAIINLLRQKPAAERWAVLVNEFGEIGVDGALLRGQVDSTNVFVAEVPGGCMCCTAGLPMQTALNRLLRQSRPHRLLIEPTGLGHPAEVLQALSAPHYQEVLALQRTFTLVDARHFSDERYTAHEIFLGQLAIADVIVANKADLYSPTDLDRLRQFLRQEGSGDRPVRVTRHGELLVTELAGACAAELDTQDLHLSHQHAELASTLTLPPEGFISVENSGEGFESIGWRFASDKIFHRGRLAEFLAGLDVVRMNAVFITDVGFFGYNLAANALSEVRLDSCSESRIEIVAEHVERNLQARLLACLLTGV